MEVVRPKKEEDLDKTPSNSEPSMPDVILRRNDFRSSTKLEALLQNLRRSHPKGIVTRGADWMLSRIGRLRDQDPCFRAVVFSQFTSFLDLIEIVLQRERLDQYRFDGSMDVKKRNEAVSEFKSPSRKPKVLIVSLKAGGVGLNVSLSSAVG